METDRRFRHELKYLISRREMDCCIGRISEFAGLDAHAADKGYFVRSLYFDDPAFSSYEEKESGTRSRHKFRIRTYNMDKSFINLENKIKEGSFVYKQSAALTEDEYIKIRDIADDFLLRRSEEAAKSFAAERRIRALRPVVMVDYDRIPLVCEHGDVRITFDMNISASPDLELFDENARSYSVLDNDLLIMEVKYTQFLPDLFRAVMPDTSCRMAASKYVMSIDVLRRIKTI